MLSIKRLALFLVVPLVASAALAQQPDLTAIKTNDVGGETTVDTPFTWSIAVANIGNATATFSFGPPLFVDNLPSSNIAYGAVSVSSPFDSSITCSINASTTLACFTISGNVDFDAGQAFNVSFSATPSSAGVFVNPTAGQCAIDPFFAIAESNEANNACSDSVTVTTGATGPDLTVTKGNDVSDSTELGAGAFTWSLAVANGGDTDATFSSGQTILSDNLPNSDITYDSPTVTNENDISGTGNISCSVATSNLTCIASGGTVTLASATGGFTVNVDATPTVVGTFDNPRSGGSCSVDPGGVLAEGDETNNSCSNSVSVSSSPDLTITKSNDVTGAATVDEAFTWSLVVQNDGGEDFVLQSSFPLLSDTLPDANMTYGTVSQSSSGMTGTVNCVIETFNLACRAAGEVRISSGGSFTASFSATPTTAGTFDNPRSGGVCLADPAGNDLELDETNNSCSDSVVATTGQTGPDLTVAKTNDVGGALELAEGSFDWSIQVSNGGDTEATWSSGQTLLSDTLPNVNMTYSNTMISAMSGVTGTVDCSILSSNLTCLANGSVTVAAGGGSFTVQTTATPSAVGTFDNPRAGGSCSVDPNDNIVEDDEGNNSCSDSVVVNPSPDLTATKTNDVLGTPTQDVQFTWSILVQNVGGAAAIIPDPFPVVIDSLPDSGMDYGSPSVVNPSGLSGTVDCAITSSNLVCTASGGEVTLAVGGFFTVEIPTTATTFGTFDNPRAGGTCGVDSTAQELETNETNNECSDSVVVPNPDTTAPTVTQINTDFDTGDGDLAVCEAANVPVRAFDVTFSEAVQDPAGNGGANDVTNPANYLVVGAGADRSFQTTVCNGAPAGDDTVLTINSVSYDSGSLTATLSLDGLAPDDRYTLLVCDEILDEAGNALDGDGNGTGGDDFSQDFRVDSQNLLDNGHFDCDFSSWTAVSTDPNEITRSDVDHEDSLDSGSALVTNLTASTTFVGSQCVSSLSDSASYQLSVKMRASVTGGVALSLTRACTFYNAASCTGAELDTVGETAAVSDTAGSFVDLADELAAPATSQSADCFLLLSEPSGGDFDVYFDVVKLEFVVLFADSFESGNTSAWSSVTQ